MPFYPELGRHTPPPPPYSSGQRNCSKAITTFEASQRSDPPPPPPPTLYSTQGKECRVPSTREREQTVTSSDPYLRHSSVAIPAPPALPQFAAAQSLNPGQPNEYHTRNQNRESIRFGMPVEPNLAPGSHGHPLRSFAGLPLESTSEPVPHQSLVYDQGAEFRPDYYSSATQSLNTSFLSQNVTPYANQTAAYGLAADDRQPLPTFRGYSSTTIPSLAYPNGLDVPIPVDPPGAMYLLSTLPSQQAVARRPTLTAVTTANALPQGRHLASPSRPYGPNNDLTSRGSEKWRRVSQSNHRRPSVSVRFEPYKRRQSSAASENTEQLRLAGEVDKEAAKEDRADSDVSMDGRVEEAEGERKY